MMDTFILKKLISVFLLPPGVIILLLLIAIYLQARKKQIVFYILMLITAVFYLLSTAFVSNLLLKPLEEQYTSKQARADAIIVLGGGTVLRNDFLHGQGMLSEASASRLLTALQLYHLYQVPIIVSGGAPAGSGNEAEISKEILLNSGVPEEKIIIENQARDTRENIKFLSTVLEEKQFKSAFLVTSAFHMPRSMLICNNNSVMRKIKIIPYPCHYQTDAETCLNIFSFIPSQNALNNSYLALHEYLGLLALPLKM